MSANLGTIYYEVDAKTGKLLRAQKDADKFFDTVERKSKKADRGVDGLVKGFSRLAMAVNLGMLAMAAKRFLDIADNVSLLRARVSRLSSGMADAKQNFEGIIAIANRTGMSVKDTTQLWESLKSSLQDTSATSGQVLILTQALQQLGRIGGSSSEDMSNALRQLGQSIAGGVVRAEEFNSVMEGMPEVWRTVARQMGVSIGELRAKMLDGKLTAEEVVNAILAASGNIETEFKKLPVTTDQAFSELKTQFELLIDVINQELHVTELVVAATKTLGNEIKELSSWFKGLTSDSASLTDKLWNLAGVFESVIPGFSLFREQAEQSGWFKNFSKNTEQFTSTLPTGEAGVIKFNPKNNSDNKAKKKWERLGDKGVNVSDQYNRYAAAMRKLGEEQEALNAAYKQGKITYMEYTDAMKGAHKAREKAFQQIAQEAQQEGWDSIVSWKDQKLGEVDTIQQIQNEWAVRKQMMLDLGATEQAMWQAEQEHQQQLLDLQWQRFEAQSEQNRLIGSMIDNLKGGATNALTGLLNGSQSLSESFANVGTTIINSVVGSLIEMGAEYVKQLVMQEAMSKAVAASSTATAAATGASIAASMAPAAAATSVATMGAAPTVAMTALGGLMSFVSGLFSRRYNGGSVGAGGLYRVGEHNKPEIFQASNGSQYMIPGENGRVIANRDISGGGINMPVSISVYPQNGWSEEDSKKLQETMKQVAMGIVRQESTRPGGMLAPRRK
ncbi:TPA: tape measure protein [Escherichia coli]